MTMLRARRSFEIAGRQVSPGEVIDLSGLNLPRNRERLLVAYRYGERVPDTKPDTVSDSHECDLCDRTFQSSHALGIHRSRIHRGPEKE